LKEGRGREERKKGREESTKAVRSGQELTVRSFLQSCNPAIL
jgi:hypothetical protein